MGKSHLIQLRLDGRRDVRVTMTKTRHRSPARSVKILFIISIIQVNTLPTLHDRKTGFRVARKDMRQLHNSKLGHIKT